MAVLAFSRDQEKGERICQALKGAYSPSLVIHDQERDVPQLMEDFDAVVAVMAVGIVVRKICPKVHSKWTDSPVVAVDSSFRCAVPVIGGHHGANNLALHLAQALGLFPALTTATDAAGKPHLEGIARALGAEVANKEASKAVNLAFLREDVPILKLKGPRVVLVDEDVAVLKGRGLGGGLVVGLGARRGVTTREVLEAIDAALQETGRGQEEIRILATAWIKHDEEGFAQAAEALHKDLVFLPKEVLNAQSPQSSSRAADLGLLGVAEPAVLALAERLILPKKKYGRVTVALGE